MKFILFAILVALSLNSCSQTLISKNSWFLAGSAKPGYIAYFKSDSDEPDEYLEGHVFIFDINKNESYPLNNDIYILNFLNVSWSSNNDAYFMSSGSSLDYYSFVTKERHNLFSASENGIINSFSVSNNGNLVALNEKIIKKNSNTQVFYLIDINKKSTQKIFEIDDLSIGESLANIFLFDSNDENIFIETISGELIYFNIKSSMRQDIDSDIDKMFCVSGDNLYYQKNGNLIQYNYKSKEQVEIITGGNNIDFQYVNSAKGNNIVINFNDNVFIYDENSGLKKVPNLPKGEYVYIKDGLAIETLDNNLLLHIY